jgi:hypothetical protein
LLDDHLMRLRSLGPLLALSLVACAADPSADPPTLAPEQSDGIDGDGTGEEDDVAPAPAAEDGADGAAVNEADDDARAELAGELSELAEDTAVPSEIPPPESIAEPALAAAPKILYLNFAGPVIRNCSTFCNDSVNNRSSMIGQTFKRSSVDFLPYTSATGRSVIVAGVKSYFSRYNVTVTTKRPAPTVKYTMAVISPSNVGPITRRGTSYLDCANAMSTDVVFVYRIGGTSASRIARYVAHEVGHSFGLMHVTSTSDLMQYASSGTHWTLATLDVARNPVGYTCWPGKSTQNEPAALAAALGLRP